jgi:hypothetical protein
VIVAIAVAVDDQVNVNEVGSLTWSLSLKATATIHPPRRPWAAPTPT